MSTRQASARLPEVTPDDVLAFWLDEVGAEGWYRQSDELDAEIRDRFLASWERGREGAHGLWLTYPSGTLAYCILMDQFPRNMFRDDRRAFATDPAALAAGKMAVNREWDLRIDEPSRQFFYLPMMHSESLSDQDRCCRLFHTRMPAAGADNFVHARAHREVIRRFGRFPHRNEVLGRQTRPDEAEFLRTGGYGAVVRKLKGEAASSGG